MLSNILMIKYKLLEVALTCFRKQFARTDLNRKQAVSQHYPILLQHFQVKTSFTGNTEWL